MRWWLALTFAAIVALTAFSVAEVFNTRAASAFHDRAEELAIGQSVSASRSVGKALRKGILADAVPRDRRPPHSSVYVFSTGGDRLSGDTSRAVRFEPCPRDRRRFARRCAETATSGRSTTASRS